MNENPEHSIPDYRDSDHDASIEDPSIVDYEVGYKKPPKSTQFQRGQSGNPQGRPKGTKNFKTDLQEELLEQIRVTEGGRTVVLSKQRAMLKRTVELSLKGDIRATSLLIRLISVHLVLDEQEENPTPLSQEDRAILERFFAGRGAREQETSTQQGGRHDVG
ncbi:DUF5681 domain-containing protein [Candidatus Nitronereus thalassa]|uniref:DUF5681 domain-containing protein n=1 Tax=Candidatus Nitronereus thalassa TaxID=3020898 RepID=A0ABU3K324_9BACT|nr:DUF5681 domain-containing protein [Candidatus Nitronereus thalassa]MDT7040791.1 DUF5681 domain-containing protein [Candidatus Nitronereus thalassa]